MNHIAAPTPKDDVVAILGTIEIAKQCDAVVRGVSSFGDLILDQVMDAWKEKGKDIISKQLTEKFTDDQERMDSDKLLEQTLEKMRADKGASPKP
jgi:2C-methyl-D-erythritol 2,4-cyclodiphosphate synthase